MQVPRQALLQQVPSMQKPEPHSDAIVQVPPFGFLFVAQVVPEPLQYCIGWSQGVAALKSCWPAASTVQLPSEPGLPQL
jgi:hypothetical protein